MLITFRTITVTAGSLEGDRWSILRNLLVNSSFPAKHPSVLRWRTSTCSATTASGPEAWCWRGLPKRGFVPQFYQTSPVIKYVLLKQDLLHLLPVLYSFTVYLWETKLRRKSSLICTMSYPQQVLIILGKSSSLISLVPTNGGRPATSCKFSTILIIGTVIIAPKTIHQDVKTVTLQQNLEKFEWANKEQNNYLLHLLLITFKLLKLL